MWMFHSLNNCNNWKLLFHSERLAAKNFALLKVRMTSFKPGFFGMEDEIKNLKKKKVMLNVNIL